MEISTLLSNLAWLMALSSGVMAGVYWTFSIVVMPSLASLDLDQGAIAMNAINRIILKTLFMPLFFASTLIAGMLFVSGLWLWQSPGAGLAVTGAVTYMLGMFGVTAIFNVPLNEALDRAESENNESQETLRDRWQHYQIVWTRWNTVRSVSCTVTLIIMLELL